MSASAVLNLIAPSAPLPLQAVSDIDASAFDGLLSDAVSGDASAGDSVPPRPTTLPPRDVAKTTPGTVALDDTTPRTLIDPTSTGLIQTLPPAPLDQAAVNDSADIALTFPGPSAEGDAEPSATDTFFKAADEPPVMPLPGVQTAGVSTTSKTTTVVGTTPVLPAVTTTDAAEAALLTAAAQAVTDGTATDDAQTLPPATPDKTAATTPPIPQVQPPAPAPLKAAAERTGRSHDGLTRESSEARTSGDGVTASTTTTASASAPATPVPGKTSTDTAALPSAAVLASGDGDLSGDLNTEGAAASLDTARTQAEAAVTHHASLSTLSRATIDATAQIAAQIIRKLDGKSTRFEMALTPDDLGRVDVKLEIDAEGRLAARMAFDNPAAAADLRGRADELRRQLQDAGFHVPDDAFEFAERDSGSSAFDRGASDHNDNQRQNRAFSAASRLNAETDVAQPPRWMSLSLRPSGVDLKV